MSDRSLLLDILHRYWNYSAFRPQQEEIVNKVISGCDTIVVMPTGAGKSLCYQLPALLMEGLCLVVSPLVSLMNDQVAALQQKGIAAAALHGGLTQQEVIETLEEARNGKLKILYISPERIRTALFQKYLPVLQLSLLAVDEAHCVSQWGHDYRPDFLQIYSIRLIHRKIPVIAVTATATREIISDIAQSLQLRVPEVYTSSFVRKNLSLTIVKTDAKQRTIETLIGGYALPSIIYTRSRRETEGITKLLNRQNGVAVGYHAGMVAEKKDLSYRRWMNDETKVMVATTAFGMGIDKPNVRSIIHERPPESIEYYYQETGRAGRDGNEAKAILLYSDKDILSLQNSVDRFYPPDEYIRRVYQSVAEYLQIPISAQPDNYYPFDLNEFCTRFKLKIEETSSALKILERQDLWTLTESVYRPATIAFTCYREELMAMEVRRPSLYVFIVALLRIHNGVLHYPSTLKLKEVAKATKLKMSVVMDHIHELERMGLLSYVPVVQGPLLRFHHRRVDSRFLIIDHKKINFLKDRHIARTLALTQFVTQKNICRERLLTQYFDEEHPEDCGHCDVCIERVLLKNSVPTRKEIIDHIGENDISINELATIFSVDRERLVTVIRQIIEDGELTLQGKQLRVTKRKK